MGGLGQERLADVAVGAFLFAAAFRRVGLGMHEAHAQHSARSGQPGVGERRAVIGVQHDGRAAVHDRPAQQLLAGACVLVGEKPALDDQAGVVIDDQEQLCPHRRVDPWPGHPGPDEHVGDPPVIGRELGQSEGQEGEGLPVRRVSHES